MQRFWPILFAAMAIAMVAMTVYAGSHWWFPAASSTDAESYDSIFNLFLFVIAIGFFLTQGLLIWCLWRFSSARNPQAGHTEGNMRLEIVWTVVPIIIFGSLAIYQLESWAEGKVNRPETAPLAEVTGRRFQWDARYPGPDGYLHTRDDLVVTDGTVHIPVDIEDPESGTVLLKLRSDDVIHSFFVPSLRLKQDLVPGIDHEIWFTPTQEGEYDIICAELCGWGHGSMRGRLIVESPEAYANYLDELTTAQAATSDE